MNEDVNLSILIMLAKEGNEEAMTELLIRYHLLLVKDSINHFGYFDEDCYQTLAEQFIKAVKKFDPSRKTK